ncbi:MAG: hypothetical protein EP336_09345 [Rhodobacteraceae bacterium]|nr:MAG: hypothetical protein EP336_09345 [Paracoccaceae bacterium]
MMLKYVKTNWLIGQSPVDRILEGIVGSSYEIRYWVEPRTGDVTFTRVKGDGRKWNEPDPDRRHWFECGEDGALYPKQDQQIKIGIDLGSDEKTENQGEVKP